MSDTVGSLIFAAFETVTIVGEFWFFYVKVPPGRIRFMFALASGSAFSTLLVCALVTGDTLFAFVSAIAAALWLWLAWRSRPPRKRSPRKVTGAVHERNGRLVVIPIPVKR